MKHPCSIFSLVTLTLLPGSCFAADSYRWLHVTIDTPWMIFIFLLPMVLIPAILMAVLYWRFAGVPKKEEAKKEPGEPQLSEEAELKTDAAPDSNVDNIRESTDR